MPVNYPNLELVINMTDLMTVILTVWQEDYFYKKVRAEQMIGMAAVLLVILGIFLLVELLVILSIKNCIP